MFRSRVGKREKDVIKVTRNPNPPRHSSASEWTSVRCAVLVVVYGLRLVDRGQSEATCSTSSNATYVELETIL